MAPQRLLEACVLWVERSDVLRSTLSTPPSGDASSLAAPALDNAPASLEKDPHEVVLSSPQQQL